MKRWILALVMLGLSVVPALAETAVTTGMGYKKMLSELCALYKQESGKQLTEVYSGTIGSRWPSTRPEAGFPYSFRTGRPWRTRTSLSLRFSLWAPPCLCWRGKRA